MIDSVIIPVAAVGTLLGVSYLGMQGVDSVIAVGTVIFILEPLLVSVTGASLGHHWIGMRVINRRTSKNINIFAAVIRFVVKIILGPLSLVTLFTTRRHQAVHDLLTDSIMVLKRPQSLPGYEVLDEREIEQAGYTYPSKVRRITMTAIYSIVLFITFSMLSALLLSESCMGDNRCSDVDRGVVVGFQTVWLAGVIALIILCWRARLFGCRRQLN